MAPTGWQPLQSIRLNRMMRGLQDERTIPQELVFSNRIPDVDAVDGEIPDTWMTPEWLEPLVADATAVSVALGDSRQVQVPVVHGTR